MKGFKTSFFGMFQPSSDEMPAVNRVEIPLIQRDYAQGRDDPSVQVIRRDFLEVLIGAITDGDPVDLDFVYGEIEDGTLRPLDGQQRLTTLFLIHWYVATRTGRLVEAGRCLKFTYATRPTTELFCRQLVKPEHALTEDFSMPSDWIANQAWYLFAWRHDPSVQSMLVMLDAIHKHLSMDSVDLDAVWSRLTNPTSRPAISFYFLPIEDMPSGEELYIKMNSRGKPLTEFENFKARFERILADVLPAERFDKIVHKLDGAWTDVLWPYHDGDHIVDDEFLRYLEFVIEVCEWRDGTGTSGRLLDRAERVFASGNPNAQRNVDFLFHAFDTWIDVGIADVFATHFARPGDVANVGTNRVILFESSNLNLFQESCRRYGRMNGKARLFTLSETLLLFAVLIHRQFTTDDIQIRLRNLRNLTDRSDEVRVERMVDLIDSVERLIRHGSIQDLKGFNPDRVLDEQAKRDFIGASPDQETVLYHLEDHPMLRGRVFAFDLDAGNLKLRAAAFGSIAQAAHWPLLTASLLANGDYGYPIGQRAYQYGSGNADQGLRWREVFTHYGRGRNGKLPSALGDLLDLVASSTSDTSETLRTVAEGFSQQRRDEQYLDWRYYLVTYAAMREGDTGIYFGEHLAGSGHWGFSMCMLRTASLTGSALYRDPYLLAALRTSGAEKAVRDPWFSGYESEPRWLRLAASETGIRCTNSGFELDAPLDEVLAPKFQEVCEKHGAIDRAFLPVAQIDRDGELVDTEDRIQKCAAFLRDLVAAGL